MLIMKCWSRWRLLPLGDPSIPPAVGLQEPSVSEGRAASGGFSGKQWFGEECLARCCRKSFTEIIVLHLCVYRPRAQLPSVLDASSSLHSPWNLVKWCQRWQLCLSKIRAEKGLQSSGFGGVTAVVRSTWYVSTVSQNNSSSL